MEDGAAAKDVGIVTTISLMTHAIVTNQLRR
jgi:hypothetical protein